MIGSPKKSAPCRCAGKPLEAAPPVAGNADSKYSSGSPLSALSRPRASDVTPSSAVAKLIVWPTLPNAPVVANGVSSSRDPLDADVPVAR